MLVVTAMLTTGACSEPGSASAGFGSYAGVLGCAELVAWGTVTGSEPVTEGLEVAFVVKEWVYPGAGRAAAEVTQGVVVERRHKREQCLVPAVGELSGSGDHRGADADQLDLVGVERRRLHQLHVASQRDSGSV